MAFNYIVNISQGNNGPWTATPLATITSDTIGGLAPTTAYYFQIIPVDQLSQFQGAPTVVGPYSTTGSPPTAPTGLNASNVTINSVTISWTAST